MDSFEKKLKDKFLHTPNDQVPTYLDYKFMEEGILSRISNTKKDRKIFWYWISLGLFIIAIALSCLLVGKQNNPKTENLQATVEKSTLGNEETLIKKNQINNTKSKLEPIQNTSRVFDLNKDLEDKNNVYIKENNRSGKYRLKKNTKLTIDESMLNNDINIFNTINSSPTEFIVNNENLTSVVTINKENIKKIHILKINQLPLEDRIVDKISFFETTDETACKNHITKYATMSSGTLFSSSNILGNHNKNYTSPISGFNLDLNFGKVYNGKWGYEIGLGVAYLVNDFNFESIDTFNTNEENVLIKTITNTISGSVRNVTADTIIMNIRTRKESRYNTLSSINFSIGVNRRIDIAKTWHIRPSINLAYHRIIGSDIKTLDLNDEIIVNSPLNESLTNHLIVIGTKFNIGYQLSDHISAVAILKINQNLNSLIPNYSDKAATMGFNLGISYSF